MCSTKHQTSKIKHQKSKISLWALLLLLASCANPIAPTGGPRDEQPPRVDSLRSTPNGQTNFRPRTIELTFDEWVKLEKANTEVVVSPPIQGYTTKLKGKTVIIDLGDKDTLRSNVTYVVQMGKSVKDLTEGNVAPDLRFVFSTGPYIDSLSLTGTVLDAYTAEPVKDVLVMLYDNLADTVFQKERPFYFARTDDAGAYRLSNLRAGRYKLTALKDADANYRYNQPSESIAFAGAPIDLGADTTAATTLRMFQERPALQLVDSDTRQRGRVKLVFNRPAWSEVTLTGAPTFSVSEVADTLLLWHAADTSWNLYLAADTLLRDTLTIPALDTVARRQPLVWQAAGGPPKLALLGQPVALALSQPVAALDTARVRLTRDTLPDALPYIWATDTTDARRLLLTHPGAEGKNYRLTLLPGAATDYLGNANTDTLTQEWTIADAKRYGVLRLALVNTDSTQHYVVRLVPKGKLPVATVRVQGLTDRTETFANLQPGEYNLEIITDPNNNGRWDPGHYATAQQPEPVRIRKLETLRANWEVDVVVELGDSE